MSERTALVTGGSNGIGRAVVKRLVDHGQRVAFTFHRDKDGAEELERGSAGRAHAFQWTATDEESALDLFSQVEAELGSVEVLINNAGALDNDLAVHMDAARWDESLRVNLDASFWTTKRALRGMMRQRFGRIVSISSVAAYIGSPGQSNYAAAKAGLIGFSRAVAREVAGRGITCNVVAPGPVATRMILDLPEALKTNLASLVPIGRPGTADEVAYIVSVLAADEASFVTGAVVPVDGGMGMGL